MAAMESGWPVELPRARAIARVGPRRHRRLTMPSGALLFLCMFLPAVKGCSEPVYPLEAPVFWHPYIYGAVLAVAATATTMRGVQVATIALRVLAYLCIAAGLVLVMEWPEYGIVELLLGAILLGTIGVRGVTEKRVAITGIVVSVCSLLWFGLWSASKDALIGVYISLGAAIFLLTGSLFWLSEI